MKSFVDLFRKDDDSHLFRMLTELCAYHLNAVQLSVYSSADGKEIEAVFSHQIPNSQDLPDTLTDLAADRKMVLYTAEMQSSEVMAGDKAFRAAILPLVFEESPEAVLEVVYPLSTDDEQSIRYLVNVAGIASQFLKDNHYIEEASQLSRSDRQGIDPEHVALYEEVQALLSHSTVEIEELVALLQAARRMLE